MMGGDIRSHVDTSQDRPRVRCARAPSLPLFEVKRSMPQRARGQGWETVWPCDRHAPVRSVGR